MKQLYITLILLLLHLCTSCDDQRLFDDFPHDEGYTYLSFNVGKSLLVETTTRATAEDIFNKTGIRDLHLLVFDKNKKFKSCEKVDLTTMHHSIALARCTFKTLIEIKVDDVIVMLANTGINQIPDNITFDNMNEKFMPTRWKITDETENLIDKDLPMYGIIDAWKGNGAGQVLSLKKSVAKLNFYVNNIPNSIGDVKWMVAHVPLTGVIFHDEKKLTIETSPNLTDDSFYVPTKEGQYLDLYLSGTGFATGKKHAYCPAYPSATTARLNTGISNQEFHKDRLCILMWVAGRDNNIGQYYRVDIAKPNPGGGYTWLDMKPGYNYNITLTGINGKGYNTKEEALNSPPGNLTYDIEVTGEDDNLTIATGQYALELEYDSLSAYSYVYDEFTIKAKAIIPQGSGMPSTNSVVANGFIINNSVSSITEQEQVIRFQALAPSQGYSDNHRGSITFNLGTISKTVNIYIRGRNLDAHPETVTYTGDFSKIYWQQMDQGITCRINATRSISVSCEENATPVAWYNHNTQMQSNSSDPEAEPLFETRMMMGYGQISAGNSRTKVIITQNAPCYMGWSGGSNASGARRFVVENREETNGSSFQQYYWASDAYWGGEYIGSTYNDLTDGLHNTSYLMSWPEAYPAAYACWQKNDKNNDGIVEGWEVGENPWYLPSHHQMIQLWSASTALLYPFRTGYYYMSSTEFREPPKTSDPNYIYQYHLTIMSTGSMYFGKKFGAISGVPTKYNVRCVKNI